MDSHKRKNPLMITSKLILFTGVLMFINQIILVRDTHAIFNCFSAYGKNKGYPQGNTNQALVRPGPGNWYPMASFMIQQPSPMSSLFGSKWMQQKPAFGKSWNWKFGNSFYRPGIGYGSAPIAPLPSYANYPSSSNYAPPGGWSVPLSGDGHDYVEQKTIPIRPTTGSSDPYKPFISNTNKQWGSKNTPTASNYISPSSSVDIVDSNDKRLYGYRYPNWYSGVVDSPAKIAQQLAKQGIKGALRQSADVTENRVTSSSGFTIFEEPRFVGYGSVQTVNNREARLSCSFGESIDRTNRPLWVKFVGSYNATQVVNGKVKPPFNCANTQCRTQEIDVTKDFRYRLDNGPATSTLIITEPRLADYGIYRCSALSIAAGSNSLETLYQVIIFGA